MRPTEILSSEHRVIERVLDCLHAMASHAREERTLDAAAAGRALEFLRTFADTCHHHKEEQVLFKMMERRGVPARVGPVAVMLSEHESGRALVRAMQTAIDAFNRGEVEAALRFAQHAESYVELLGDHIQKEDQVLFPMAEAVMRDEDRAQVLRDFQHHESADLHPDLHGEMLALADALCAQHSVSARPRQAAEHACCHHAVPHGCH